MASIYSVSAASSNAATATTAKTTAFDGSEFMQILLAQLKNQNPLEPMDNQQMMNQMVSLNTMQEIQAMSANIKQLSGSNTASLAASLIGKQVKAALSDGTTIEGVVDSTTIANGIYFLNIGDKQVTLSEIISISQAAAPTTPSSSSQAGDSPSTSSQTMKNVEKVAYV